MRLILTPLQLYLTPQFEGGGSLFAQAAEATTQAVSY